MSLESKIKALAKEYAGEIIANRRYLHTNPELSFQEFNTQKFVAEKLKELGIQPEPIANTGLVATIEGRNAQNRVVGLRADMDALPIHEKNNVPYKSHNEGVMHACGHDVHTASLLGTAKILTQLKGEFDGTIKLVFQPAEEKAPGGASIMISCTCKYAWAARSTECTRWQNRFS